MKDQFLGLRVDAWWVVVKAEKVKSDIKYTLRNEANGMEVVVCATCMRNIAQGKTSVSKVISHRIGDAQIKEDDGNLPANKYFELRFHKGGKDYCRKRKWGRTWSTAK